MREFAMEEGTERLRFLVGDGLDLDKRVIGIYRIELLRGFSIAAQLGQLEHTALAAGGLRGVEDCRFYCL
ncbi:hypothetical protein FGO68_gene7224 [Halteria grandinella]|uniref:Uncharacterized protein n=1 Tax=Halteria grandinella TaxID=5974 RepID=A0A8J8NUV4_HALGN|nr:hypothetical protein FGO68_gene7224 [Halteria grandinella]